MGRYLVIMIKRMVFLCDLLDLNSEEKLQNTNKALKKAIDANEFVWRKIQKDYAVRQQGN